MSSRGAILSLCLCLATKNQSETSREVTDGCGLKDIIISAGTLGREEKHFPAFSAVISFLYLTKAQSHKAICMQCHESNITRYIGRGKQVVFTLPLVALDFFFFFFWQILSLFTCTSKCLSLTSVQPLNAGDVIGIQQ